MTTKKFSNFYYNRDRRCGPITEKRSEAISLALTLRYEKKGILSRASISAKKCWDSGKRSGHKLIWTPEMDAALIALAKNHQFKWMRTEGAKKIGVGEHSLRTRLKYLGIKCKRRKPKS